MVVWFGLVRIVFFFQSVFCLFGLFFFCVLGLAWLGVLWLLLGWGSAWLRFALVVVCFDVFYFVVVFGWFCCRAERVEGAGSWF